MGYHSNSDGELISRLSHGEQLRVFLETCPSAVIVTDGDGMIRGFGRAAEEMFGYSEAEVLGRNVNLLMAPPHKVRHDRYVDRFLKTGEKRIIGKHRIESACDKEGRFFPVEISIGEAQADGVRYFVGFLRDAAAMSNSRTNLNSAATSQADAARAQSMSALATVIAHELNQPLTTIANYTESVRDILARRGPSPEDDEIISILDRCSQQAVRSGELLHRLRDFVKGKDPTLERVAIEDLVDEAVKLSLLNGFRRNVSIEVRLGQDLPDLLVDRLQCEQLLINVIRNAFDAMHAQDSGGHYLRISARADTAFVTFTVCDSGPGIDPALRPTLFEKFATRKGHGMGVGLSICRQIVETHGGKIWADAECPLGGASLSFTLPVVPEVEAREV